MILLRDASRLALTKLKVRVPRYVITVVISSLVFAAVVLASTVFTGAMKSVDTFQDSPLAQRYFVKTLISPPIEAYTNTDLVAKVEQAQADQIAQKKAAAKKLGIEYVATDEESWVIKLPDGSKAIGMGGNPAIDAIVAEWVHQQPKSSFRYFTDYAKKHGALATYRFKEYNIGTTTYLQVLKDGKESFKKRNGQGQDMMQDPMSMQGLASVAGGVRTIDSKLLKDVVLPGQTLDKSPTDGSIPLVTTFSVAEESLGLTPLLPKASPDQKLARVKEVRKNIAGKTVQVCYRNSASSELLNKTIDQIAEIERNRNNKDYVKPAVIYGLPATACGDVTIVKDSRTAEQKTADTKQEQFDRQFGAAAPASRIVTFRVAGVMADENTPSSDAIIPLISKFARSTITSGWVMPEDLVSLPELEGIVAPLDKEVPLGVGFVAELPDVATKKKFIDDLSCYAGPASGVVIEGKASDGNCAKEGNYYMFESFGNNASAIHDVKQKFTNFLLIGLLALSLISGLIMMGTIGRIIADSRRETAVFRAIGATRLDISLVYVIYTLIMAGFVTLSTVLIGLLAAFLFNSHFSPIITPEALLALNSQDSSLVFSFFALNVPHLLIIAGSIFVASLIGMLPPLIGNMRRNPIKDMRDDT